MKFVFMKERIESQRVEETPEDVIMMIRQEVYMMGANDYEIPELDRLLEKLRKGEIKPKDALAQARAIQARKQDYH